MHVYLFVELEGAARTQHYTECYRDAFAFYPVLFLLLNGCDSSYGVLYIFIYGAFAAPWAAINDGCAVGGNPYHGVVVIDKGAARDVLCPQVAVGALASSARAKEHVCLAVVLYHR